MLGIFWNTPGDCRRNGPHGSHSIAPFPGKEWPVKGHVSKTQLHLWSETYFTVRHLVFFFFASVQWMVGCEGKLLKPYRIGKLVGAQPSPCCSFARHLVGKMDIHCSFAHHDSHSPVNFNYQTNIQTQQLLAFVAFSLGWGIPYLEDHTI